MSDAFYDDDNFSDEFTPDKDLKLGVWTQLLTYAQRYPKDLVLLALCAVVVGIAEISFPLVTRWVIDDIGLYGQDIDLLGYGALYGILCVALGTAVLGFLWFGGKLRSHMSHDIRRDGFANLETDRVDWIQGSARFLEDVSNRAPANLGEFILGKSE